MRIFLHNLLDIAVVHAIIIQEFCVTSKWYSRLSDAELTLLIYPFFTKELILYVAFGLRDVDKIGKFSNRRPLHRIDHLD